ncbi:MAG: 3-dehydroquinate dehydratase [Bacteroidia bacterium]|nr:3-dehydroquinate dehydratase [Bacteroidia bacterium]
MKVIIINGPNLNLLGKREPEIYGTESFESYFEKLKNNFPKIDLEYFQSNVEGEIINKLHETGFSYQGIILNPGGYAHTSVAIADAVSAINSPVIEVHISNVFAREDFRKIIVTAQGAIGFISGFGMDVYKIAINTISKFN